MKYSKVENSNLRNDSKRQKCVLAGFYSLYSVLKYQANSNNFFKNTLVDKHDSRFQLGCEKVFQLGTFPKIFDGRCKNSFTSSVRVPLMEIEDVCVYVMDGKYNMCNFCDQIREYNLEPFISTIILTRCYVLRQVPALDIEKMNSSRMVNQTKIVLILI